jgi:HD-like signal output (HDOD) protein
MSALTPQAAAPAASNYEFVRGLVNTLVANGQVDIPVLPEVAARVVALATSHDSNAQRLSRLITADPALASHVMRVAASAVYMPNSPLASLQQAITWLGMAEVANIAFTVAVQGKLLNVPGQKSTVLAMWREAVVTGSWARELAGVARCDAGSAYLCGLLHQIGKPVVLQIVADVAERTRTPLTMEELMRMVGAFQIAVGEQVVREWKLPEAVAVTVRYWQEPRQAPSHQREAAVVGLAKRLADYALNDDSDLARNALMSDERAVELELSPENITNLLNRTERVLAQVRMY